MTRRFAVAVVSTIAVELLFVGYGSVAAHEESTAVCLKHQGVIQSDACVRDGQVLFSVPR